MLIELGQLKNLIRETAHRSLREDWWAESYSNLLHDDPALDDKETLWIERPSKKKIKKWMQAMGLAEAKSFRQMLSVIQSMTDSDIDYIKDSESYRVSSLRYNEEQYLQNPEIDATTIAMNQPPIVITVGMSDFEENDDPHFVLNDGRHRWLPALIYGAKQIRANVIVYLDDTNTGVLELGEYKVKIKDENRESLIRRADAVYRKEGKEPPDRSSRIG